MMLSIRICTIAAIASVALADKHAATTAAGGTTAGVKSPSLVTDDGHLILKTGKGKKVGYTLGGKNRFFAEMDKELADVTDTLEELAGTAADTAEIRTGFDIGYRSGVVDGKAANNSNSYNSGFNAGKAAGLSIVVTPQAETLDSKMRSVLLMGVSTEMVSGFSTIKPWPAAYAAARSTAANAKKVRVHFFGMDDIFSTLAALPAVPFKCTYDTVDTKSTVDAKSHPMYVKVMQTATGAKYFGECQQPQLVDKYQAFPELTAKYKLTVVSTFLGKDATIAFKGSSTGNVVNFVVRANHVVHQDKKTNKFVEQTTTTGVPVAYGAGFPKYGKYKCKWSHAHQDSQTTVTLDAKWMDEEHVKCGQFPPKGFSQGRADAQGKDGSKVFMVRVQPMIGLKNPDKQGAEMVYEPIEYADGSDGPAFRYDFGKCIDGLQNFGEIGLDCGQDAGCGYCKPKSKKIGEPCDRSEDCEDKAKGGCAAKKCSDRIGLAYSGETASGCKDAFNKGGKKTGQYWLKNSRFAGSGGLFWCDQQVNGGGWMLVAKILGNDGDWHYGGKHWSQGNSHGKPPSNTGELADMNTKWRYKSPAFNNFKFSSIMMALRKPSATLVRSHGTFNRAWDLFNVGGSSNGWNGPGKGTFFNWMQRSGRSSACFNWQPNCNQNGFNVRNQGQYGRFSWSGNNEGDCGTNDSCIGFGCKARYTGNIAAGYTCNGGSVGGFIWLRE